MVTHVLQQDLESTSVTLNNQQEIEKISSNKSQNNLQLSTNKSENIAEFKPSITQTQALELYRHYSIQYQSECNKGYPDALGTFDRTNNEICIWGPVERFEGAGEIMGTVTHEVGHNVHENIMAQRPEVAEKWDQLNEQSREIFAQDGTGFVSEYARTNVYEDFAETYMTYVRDPEKLSFYSPEKYEFMRNEVFSGTTYSSPIQLNNVLLSECSN